MAKANRRRPTIEPGSIEWTAGMKFAPGKEPFMAAQPGDRVGGLTYEVPLCTKNRATRLWSPVRPGRWLDETGTFVRWDTDAPSVDRRYESVFQPTGTEQRATTTNHTLMGPEHLLGPGE